MRELGKLCVSLKEARKFASELLVEQFIEGREMTVGIVGDQALPVIEIRAKQDFYNFANKYPFLNPNAAAQIADHFLSRAADQAPTKRVSSRKRPSPRTALSI